MSSTDNATSKNDRDTNVANGEEQQKIEAPKKTVKATPIFTRPKRVGLSERKVDSRALQLKVNLTKNADNLRNKRGKNEDTTNSSGPSQQGSNSNVSGIHLVAMHHESAYFIVFLFLLPDDFAGQGRVLPVDGLTK